MINTPKELPDAPEFSHGLCPPECMKKLYPEFAGEAKNTL